MTFGDMAFDLVAPMRKTDGPQPYEMKVSVSGVEIAAMRTASLPSNSVKLPCPNATMRSNVLFSTSLEELHPFSRGASTKGSSEVCGPPQGPPSPPTLSPAADRTAASNRSS